MVRMGAMTGLGFQERFPMHMQGGFLERAPDLGGSHTGQRAKVGLPSQQHVGLQGWAGASMAQCVVWNVSWLVVTPASRTHTES